MAPSLLDIYHTLRRHFGALHGTEAARAWWPIFGDDPPFEMALGAVLVQQTRWETVEGAILRLRDGGLLTPVALAQAAPDAIAALLRPVAFYTQKAPGIIAISAHICAQYGGDTATMLAQPTAALRRELLALPRIGPETADVILLYAGAHPVFVVDDYTRRLFERVQPSTPAWANDEAVPVAPASWTRARYDRVAARITHALANAHLQRERAGSPANDGSPAPVTLQPLYADFHALINEECVRYCLTRPRCDGPPARRVYSVQPGRDSYLERHDGCPLRAICAFYQTQPREDG